MKDRNNGLLTANTIPSGFSKAGFKIDGGIQSAIIEITPEMAVNWLKRNKSNRPITEKNVKFICSEINNDRWVFNGESIKFDKNFDLIDGQHRLSAIVATGKHIQMSVVVGLEKHSFATIDTGKNRSAADTLAILGKNNYASLAAVTRFVINFNETSGLSAAHGGGRVKISNQRVIDFVDDNPDIEKCNDISVRIRAANKAKFINIRFCAGLMFLFAQKRDYKTALDFFRKLLSGDNLSGNNPIKILRQKLIVNAMSGRQEKMRVQVIVAIVIKAWNLWIQGKDCKVLRFTKDENFPVIK